MKPTLLIVEDDRRIAVLVAKNLEAAGYACHVAAGKPFLRLQIPQQPEVPIMRFDPAP